MRAALALLLAACGSNVSTAFPEGLRPLARATAPPPAALPGDPHPEALSLVSGTREGTAWVHGRAYVHAPLAATWAAMREPDACVDRREVARWTVQRDVEPRYLASYRIHNVVDSIVRIEFENTWRHGVMAGTIDQPLAVVATYRKTWGSSYIALMEGSVVARRVDDRTTELELVEHLRSARGGAAPAESTVRDYFASVVARAHGRPLPVFR